MLREKNGLAICTHCVMRLASTRVAQDAQVVMTQHGADQLEKNERVKDTLDELLRRIGATKR
jgi:hypothetical protein